ncbi:type II toxin-antitoxin system HicB family antitoxin [Companilactobacillus zhachilii]|uniref:type II toxin-antitoxin system HicB family antitoxin n=1 Tax=Companilactobacillus zhachilii TaxID=2304606 RepID=UPI0040347769
MNRIYPIVIIKTDDKLVPYFVNIPDLNGKTQGTTIYDAIQMARDYINLKVTELEDNHEPIPESNYSLPQVKKSDIATLVDVDTAKYSKFE